MSKRIRRSLCIFSSFFVSRDVRAARMLVRQDRKTPPVIAYLGRVLPYAVMAMLVVYCLKGISFSAPGNFLPELLCVALVAALHVWKRNTLLSIAAGTVAYMLLVQLVF